MIPTTEKIVPDEMITSWVQYLAKINDMSLQTFYRLYLGYRGNVKSCDFHPSKTCLTNLNQLDTETLSDFFPDIPVILQYHTPMYMLLPTWAAGYQVRTFEYHLRNSMKNDVCIRPYLLYQYKVCPECMKEDIKKYGRVVIHVPHQCGGLKSCWKHKVHLQDYVQGKEPITESATDVEFNIAGFFYELYENPLLICAEDVQILFDKYLLEHKETNAVEILKEMAEQGYYPAWRKGKGFAQFLKEKKTTYSLNILYYLFKNVDTIQKILINEKIGRVYYIYNVVQTDGVVAKARCGSCGRIYYTHQKSTLYGLGCPYCAENVSRKDMIEKSAFDFNTIVDTKTDTEKVRQMWAQYMFTNKPGGQRVRFAKQRLGMQSRARSGEMMTIIAYRGCNDIDIRFEDGTILEHIRYQAFVKGQVEKSSRIVY